MTGTIVRKYKTLVQISLLGTVAMLFLSDVAN